MCVFQTMPHDDSGATWQTCLPDSCLETLWCWNFSSSYSRCLHGRSAVFAESLRFPFSTKTYNNYTLRFDGQLHDTVGKPVPECQTSCILLQQEMVELTVWHPELFRYVKLQSNHHHQHTNTKILCSPGWMSFLMPNRQWKSTRTAFAVIYTLCVQHVEI